MHDTALHSGSCFVVTESAAVSDRRYARRNFKFPTLNLGHVKLPYMEIYSHNGYCT